MLKFEQLMLAHTLFITQFGGFLFQRLAKHIIRPNTLIAIVLGKAYNAHCAMLVRKMGNLRSCRNYHTEANVLPDVFKGNRFWIS